MKRCLKYLLLIFIVLGACYDDPSEEISERERHNSDSNPSAPLAIYFPPVGDEWDTLSPDSLKWDGNKVAELLDYVASQNTYGFLILYKGRIVTEKYWNGWTKNTQYPIASASKSIIAFLTGVVQQEGFLNISEASSKYLGTAWSALPTAKENLITVRDHLSMTTGLDENEVCITSDCFKYVADAGKRWAYHNGSYNLLHKIIEKAAEKNVDLLTKEKLADKIGLNNWSWQDYNLELTTRDMARFGLLIQNKGTWNGQSLLADSAYFNSMIASSSAMNKSYGYLWWLNGEESYMIPAENDVKSGSLVATAPSDMFAAMGKGDKKIYVVPSKHLVIVRHGDDTGQNTFGPSSFDTELWRRLSPIIESMETK